MTIYTALKHDHTEVKNMLAKLVSNPSNRELFEKFANEMALHNKVEEQTFYNPLKKKLGKLSKTIDISEEEHEAVITLIKLFNKVKDENEKATIIKLIKKSIEAHIDKEENEVFTVAKEHFSDDEAKEIENKFKAKKEAAGKKH